MKGRPERDDLLSAQLAESTLRSVIDASPLPIVTLDTDGNVTSWNRSAERMFGWSEAEVLGRPSPTIPPDEMDDSNAVLAEVLGGESQTGLERRRRRKDGTFIDVSISTSPLLDSRGQVRGTVILAQDISARKSVDDERRVLLESEREARAAAEETERRFAFLADASEVLSSSLDYEATLRSVARLAVPHIGDWCSVHIVDEDGTVRQLAAAHIDPAKVALAHRLEEKLPFDPDASAGAAAVIRSGEPELTAEIPDELIAAASPDAETLELFRALGLKSAMVVPITARNRILGAIQFVAAESGRRYTPEDVALAVELGRRAGIAVDNARLYREAYRTAAQREAILTRITDGVMVADADGMMVFLNDAGRRILGLAGSDAPLSRVTETQSVFSTDGAPCAPHQVPLARAVFRGETIVEEELQVRRPDGSFARVQVSATPITDRDGGSMGAVATFRDVTEARQIERQKDDFLSAAAHDLKNPLATMKTLAQLLGRRLSRPDPDLRSIADGLERIDVTATRMAKLVNQLLDVTHLEMGALLDLELRETELVSLVRGVVDEHQQSSERHTIALRAETDRLVGQWDGARLERVVGNLIGNAVKYSPDGGPVDVRLALVHETDAGWAVLSVHDRGVGIPARDLPHVFERFRRASNVVGRIAGTGVGLAGAKQIVEQHGGHMTVDSREGEGSTFTVKLPAPPASSNDWESG